MKPIPSTRGEYPSIIANLSLTCSISCLLSRNDIVVNIILLHNVGDSGTYKSQLIIENTTYNWMVQLVDYIFCSLCVLTLYLQSYFSLKFGFNYDLVEEVQHN